MTVCPIECLREDSWLEKHESFVLIGLNPNAPSWPESSHTRGVRQ